MKRCENCDLEHNGNYGSGRFCNDKCARSFSTKKNREQINKKVSEKLKKFHIGVIRTCKVCGKEIDSRKKRTIQTCSFSCSGKLRWLDDEYRDNLTKKIQDRCSSVSEKERLKQIGRKGGFGSKGYTDNGVYYDSKIEKTCFEFLEKNKIIFTPHKTIPNSTKVSDVYIDSIGLWIEIDGIDREKRKEWLSENYRYWQQKLEIYKEQNLNFVIVKTFKEFCEVIKERGMV
jgi:hypothetical protein